ncbi:MAG: GNAT family N-acetyltransferase [Gallicola sp.]|nr:GNAT family N-acetyltransferase [Gallicola sp.]
MSGLRDLQREEFDSFYKVLQDSFPIKEYRSYKEQRELLDNSLYDIEVYEERGVVKGYITSWKLDTFNFVEHLVVHSKARGKGVGTKILQSAKSKWKKPIYLEVDLPEDPISRRRITFYERNGFVLNEYPYVQPPLVPGNPEIPLLIMTSHGKISEKDFQEFKRKIRGVVYLYG